MLQNVLLKSAEINKKMYEVKSFLVQKISTLISFIFFGVKFCRLAETRIFVDI